MFFGPSKKQLRAKFIEGREPLSNEAFVKALGIPEEHARWAAAARDAMADYCGLPAEYVYPRDTFSELDKMGTRFDGWDDVGLVIQIEEDLGIDEISEERAESMPMPYRFDTIGEWVKAFVACFQSWVNDGLLDPNCPTSPLPTRAETIGCCFVCLFVLGILLAGSFYFLSDLLSYL